MVKEQKHYLYLEAGNDVDGDDTQQRIGHEAALNEKVCGVAGQVEVPLLPARILFGSTRILSAQQVHSGCTKYGGPCSCKQALLWCCCELPRTSLQKAKQDQNTRPELAA